MCDVCVCEREREREEEREGERERGGGRCWRGKGVIFRDYNIVMYEEIQRVLNSI